jgi:hypothetical protein
MSVCLAGHAYLEHAVVETVWTRLTDELCGSPELIIRPVVLLLEESQLLLPGESSLEAICSPHEVVLRLVEDRLGLEQFRDLVPPLDNLLGV